MRYNNVLIVKLSAIGDVIHALPIAYVLKQTYPTCRITWIVEKAAYELAQACPYIDEVILFDKPKFKSLGGLFKHGRELSRALKSRRFDVVLDLQGLFKSAAISWLSGATERLVYCNAREGSDHIGKRICGPNASGHIVERYLDVARHLGCRVEEAQFALTISAETAKWAQAKAQQAGFSVEQPYVVLALGANWPNKRWPTEHFAALADKLYQYGTIPVMIGAPSDHALACEVSAKTEIPPVDLTGKTSLPELVYILQHAKAFVGGDTGPMHLAVAAGLSVVALFGPTDPERNGPYGGGHRVIQAKWPCMGCWKRSCPDDKDCLASISPDVVYTALVTMMNK